MHDFIIYECKHSAHDNGFGISGDIVIDMVKDLPENRNHELFFDNCFSSLRLMDELKRKRFLSVGSVRVGRTNYPVTPGATLTAKGRSFRVDEDYNTGVVKWFDSNSVQLVSRDGSVEPTDICMRRNSKEKRSVDVPRSLAVKESSAFMGGVELAAMLIELYCTDHKWFVGILRWHKDGTCAFLLDDRCFYCQWVAAVEMPLGAAIYQKKVASASFSIADCPNLAHLKTNPLKRMSCTAAEVGIAPAQQLIPFSFDNEVNS
ncbi:hypothetical protein HPB50_024813 [Hyalomma asiaticum]|uniref:Uncharacterized protein n=1 Tax=Hyalomma asiaticum TaxID=266040 RepID=A0ACB7TU56_HYAAI|nr:hypothetical protein HPB50_024813 [Hyalomma asiaticum]